MCSIFSAAVHFIQWNKPQWSSTCNSLVPVKYCILMTEVSVCDGQMHPCGRRCLFRCLSSTLGPPTHQQCDWHADGWLEGFSSRSAHHPGGSEWGCCSDGGWSVQMFCQGNISDHKKGLKGRGWQWDKDCSQKATSYRNNNKAVDMMMVLIILKTSNCCRGFLCLLSQITRSSLSPQRNPNCWSSCQLKTDMKLWAVLRGVQLSSQSDTKAEVFWLSCCVRPSCFKGPAWRS